MKVLICLNLLTVTIAEVMLTVNLTNYGIGLLFVVIAFCLFGDWFESEDKE